jgi:hypothetical protein
MRPIDVEKFIRDNDLVDVGTFAVVKIKNNEDWTKKYFCNIVIYIA